METKGDYQERIEVKLAELVPKIWMVKHRAEEQVVEPVLDGRSSIE